MARQGEVALRVNDYTSIGSVKGLKLVSGTAPRPENAIMVALENVQSGFSLQYNDIIALNASGGTAGINGSAGPEGLDGGGGAGGVSVGIMHDAVSAPAFGLNDFFIGSAGPGGLGGVSPGAGARDNGGDGIATQTLGFQ